MCVPVCVCVCVCVEIPTLIRKSLASFGPRQNSVYKFGGVLDRK